MADEPSTRVRSMVEKLLEADMADQIGQRSREIAEAVSQASDNVTHRAEEARKESAPQRREAEKAARHAARDAMRWGRRTWQHDVRPSCASWWKQRKVAIATASAAIPAGRELVEDAAVRAGIRERRENRHWAAFLPRHPDRCGRCRDRHPDHPQAGAADARRPRREGPRRGREGARGGRRCRRMGAALPAGGGRQRRQCRHHSSADAFRALGEPPDQAGADDAHRPGRAERYGGQPVDRRRPAEGEEQSQLALPPRAERKRCQIPCGWPSPSVSAEPLSPATPPSA